jgi:hypothetical protein
MMRLGEADHTFHWERHGERSFVAVDLPFAGERISLVVVTTIDKPAAVKSFAPVAAWLTGASFKACGGDLALTALLGVGTLGPDDGARRLRSRQGAPRASAPQGFAFGAMLS